MAEVEEFFIGSNYKFVKKINLAKYSFDDSESQFKCKADEVDKIVSLKKLQLQLPRYERSIAMSVAEWDNGLKLAKVTQVAKNLTQVFCHVRDKSMYLYPEECLYLLEMKCLKLIWNNRNLSIKNAYALLLATGSGCTFRQFRTYDYLVRLGFRVFKYDSDLKPDDYDSKYVTKQPEIATKVKNKNVIAKKIIKNPNEPKKVSLPNLKSNWVIISRPPQNCCPLNIQPVYDVYSFNMCFCPNPRITEIISFNETNDLKKSPISQEESILYDSQPTGNYPVYEKSVPKTTNFDKQNIYEPKVKRFKSMRTKEEPPTFSMTDSIFYDKSNLHTSFNIENLTNKVFSSKNEENMEAKVILPIDMTGNNFHSSNDKINLSYKAHDNLRNEEYHYGQTNEETSMDSASSKNLINTNSELQIFTPFEIIPGDEASDMLLNIPSHIKQKLFSIKPTQNTQSNSTKNVCNEHRICYDVYYPDNYIPKSSRPLPNFRVIVFEDNVYNFPNVYSVSDSYRNSNVPTLWAIVNSSSVSFYNVDPIVLPDSNYWDNKANKFNISVSNYC